MWNTEGESWQEVKLFSKFGLRFSMPQQRVYIILKTFDIPLKNIEGLKRHFFQGTVVINRTYFLTCYPHKHGNVGFQNRCWSLMVGFWHGTWKMGKDIHRHTQTHTHTHTHRLRAAVRREWTVGQEMNPMTQCHMRCRCQKCWGAAEVKQGTGWEAR